MILIDLTVSNNLNCAIIILLSILDVDIGVVGSHVTALPCFRDTTESTATGGAVAICRVIYVFGHALHSLKLEQTRMKYYIIDWSASNISVLEVAKSFLNSTSCIHILQIGGPLVWGVSDAATACTRSIFILRFFRIGYKNIGAVAVRK